MGTTLINASFIIAFDGTQHRYLVDGQMWANDEAADAYAPNEFGSDNSIVNTFE